MKVLITGGAGFIGYHLASYLQKKNFDVVVFDNFSRGVVDPDITDLSKKDNVNLVNGSCLNKSDLLSLGTDFSFVFHLAAIIGVEHVNAAPYRVVVENCTMLENVIEFCRTQKNLSRLLFPSTSEVYAGTLENFDLTLPTPEGTSLAVTDLKRPRTSYMLSKIVGEFMCNFSDLPCTVFRPHNVYGPRMGLVHVVPGQLEKAFYAAVGSSIDVPSAHQTRTFMFIDDALNLLEAFMLSSSCEGQTINLGSRLGEVTIYDLVEICHKVVGKDLNIVSLPSPPGSPERRCPDMTFAYTLVSSVQETSLIVGIEKTFEWYRKRIFTGKQVSAR